MSKAPEITYPAKTNAYPIVDRTKQSTAEDWIEVKEVVNQLSKRLHSEIKENEALPTSFTHQLFFDDAYDSIEEYAVITLDVVEERLENGQTVIYDVGYYDLEKSVDRITFKTFKNKNLKASCFIIYKPS